MEQKNLTRFVNPHSVHIVSSHFHHNCPLPSIANVGRSVTERGRRAEIMAIQRAVSRGEIMGIAYDEDIYEIVDLCCSLLTLVQNAFIFESREGGNILAYTRICKCASRIQNAAEKRRDTIALSELEHLLLQDRKVLW
jgi:hypothetical protein